MQVLPFTPGVAGIDEAGRGPLAGPVVVAAVILPEGFLAEGIYDSKALSTGQREEQFDRIRSESIHSIIVIDQEEIDRVNILQATYNGMVRACISLSKAPEVVRIDGNQIPPDIPYAAESWVKGDRRDASIAAASILAKVTRDRIMVEADTLYPQYGFADHKGYACRSHMDAIREHGPSPIHRKSFEPVKTMINQPCLTLDI